MPFPVMRIAPKPSRLTSKSPPILNVVATGGSTKDSGYWLVVEVMFDGEGEHLTDPERDRSEAGRSSNTAQPHPPLTTFLLTTHYFTTPYLHQFDGQTIGIGEEHETVSRNRIDTHILMSNALRADVLQRRIEVADR